jgi:site-specific recombinase XerD
LDAENFEREVRRLKQVGRLDTLTAGQRTLADLAAEHMKAERPRLADATWRTYRTIWSTHVDERILGDSARQWSHAIADASINSIRPRTVEQWRDDRLSTGAGPQSLRKTMALMQSIFERAVRDAATDTNPVKAIRKPSGSASAPSR